MSGLKPYPAYKDSGVEWLGELPVSWNRTKLKWECRLRAGGTPESTNESFWLRGDDPEGIPFVSIGDMSQRDRVYGAEKSLSPEGFTQRNLPLGKPGTVLIAMYASVGEVSTLEIEATWNQALISVEPTGESLDRRFVSYFLRAAREDLLKDVRSNTQANLNATQIADVWVPLPPSESQWAIADFLDRETAEIDEFVAESEKLITLLNERRAAVITQAVTKGLDPTAPMKDTGIEWLGQIPAHWQVVRVKHLAELLPGYAFPSSVFAPENSGPKLLRGINLGVGKLDWTDLVQVENKFGVELEEYRLDLGDLVLGMDRPIVSDGLRLAEIDEQAAGALLVQRVLRIRSQTIGTRMLSCALNSRGFLAHLEPDFTGVSVPHISEAQVGRFAIPVAPENERVDILEFLEIQTAKIDEAIATALGAIALAKERRQALISAAVTGKIDVRSAA